MLDWVFMFDVGQLTKTLPRAIGPENFTNLPKVPELSASKIFQRIMTVQGMQLLRVYFPTVPADRIATYKVDRDYLFAVLRWAKPGMITLLLRAVANRRIPANGMIAQNGNDNVQLREPIRNMLGRGTGRHRRNQRAAYWIARGRLRAAGLQIPQAQQVGRLAARASNENYIAQREAAVNAVILQAYNSIIRLIRLPYKTKRTASFQV